MLGRTAHPPCAQERRSDVPFDFVEKVVGARLQIAQPCSVLIALAQIASEAGPLFLALDEPRRRANEPITQRREASNDALGVVCHARKTLNELIDCLDLCGLTSRREILSVHPYFLSCLSAAFKTTRLDHAI